MCKKRLFKKKISKKYFVLFLITNKYFDDNALFSSNLEPFFHHAMLFFSEKQRYLLKTAVPVLLLLLLVMLDCIHVSFKSVIQSVSGNVLQMVLDCLIGTNLFSYTHLNFIFTYILRHFKRTFKYLHSIRICMRLKPAS